MRHTVPFLMGPPLLVTATSCAYITVGTGVGVGLVVNGQTVHGMMHPEAGHMLLAAPNDGFEGTCKFHGACTEGLAATVRLDSAARLCTCLSCFLKPPQSLFQGALAARKGIDRNLLRDVLDSDPVWVSTAHALASLCSALILVVAPERIIISGGVMNRTCLYPMVRSKVSLYPSTPHRLGHDG